jgi:hypothetical protein
MFKVEWLFRYFSRAQINFADVAQDVTLTFNENLQKLGLDIEKIYGVHGRPATPEEMRTSIEKRRASELKIQSGQE